MNNAGVAWASEETVMNTNFMGSKRVTDALVDLIDPNKGRIVNTSSEVASRWLSQQDTATKTLFSNPELSFDELNKSVNEHFPKAKQDSSQQIRKTNVTP